VPGRDHHVHTFLEALLTEVGAPGVGEDEYLDRRSERIHPHGAITAYHDRADVAGSQLVLVDRLRGGPGQLVRAVRHLHAVDLRRIQQALDVLLEPEDGWAARRGVGPDSFEYR